MSRRSTLVVLCLVVLAFVVRVVGNEWGFVRASTLAETGYPLPESIDRSRVLGYYVHDEFSFVRFLDYSDHLRSTLRGARSGEIAWLAVPWELYRGATVGDEMAATPFSAMVFSTLGTVATVSKAALGLGSADWWSLVTTTYRVGRLATAAFASLAMWPLALLLRRWRVDPLWRLTALALYAFQVGNVATSHWMGYNPLSIAMQSAGFLWLLKTLERQADAERIVGRRWLALGAWLGLCLATKFTVLPLMVVTAVATTVTLWAVGGDPVRRLTRIAAIGGLLAIGVGLVYGVSIGPNLLAGEHFGFDEQRRMLVDEGLDATSTFGSRAGTYFGKTLPVSFGWYPYLVGWGGVLWLVATWRRRSPELGWLLLWLGLLLAGYTSNDLGLMPGRSLVVGALWVLVAAIGLDALARRRRALAIGIGTACVVASAIAVVLVDRYFVLETDGYRTTATRWLVANVPTGSTVVVARDEKYHHIDSTLAERKLPDDARPYDVRFIEAEDLEPGAIDGWAFYWPDAEIPEAVDAEPIVELLPCCLGPRSESPAARWLRRASGHPSLDALIFKAPGLRLYRLRSSDLGSAADQR